MTIHRMTNDWRASREMGIGVESINIYIGRVARAGEIVPQFRTYLAGFVSLTGALVCYHATIKRIGSCRITVSGCKTIRIPSGAPAIAPSIAGLDRPSSISLEFLPFPNFSRTFEEAACVVSFRLLRIALNAERHSLY